MYYFGTNLDNRLSEPGFWPRPEETNRIPHDRERLMAEYRRMQARKKHLREMREPSERAGR